MNTILLVTGNNFTNKQLAKQIGEFLPGIIKIVPFYIDEPCQRPKGKFFVLFSSEEVYHEFLDLGLEELIKDKIIASRSILHTNLDKVLALPRDQEILLVNDSHSSVYETINHLKSLGLDFLKLVPYYPGCPLTFKNTSIAITPGEVQKVPAGIDHVYNIGVRQLDFKTVVKLMNYYGVLEEEIQGYCDVYVESLMDFARRISNIADETSKVMKTVRTELIGAGYYAKYHFEEIIGESAAIQRTKAVAKKLATTELSVLIEGENGTGKELFASAIHNESNRKNQPFVAINFSALPDQLIESELFGYEEGAFTGAKRGGKIGLFQQANGGTIFLDEIGDISLKMQAKLLRVIQEREIMKVGGDRIIPIDVRIIAATNRNLKEMIDGKTFREDLYYRLKEGYIHVPSLATRKEDIPLLMEHWNRTQLLDGKKVEVNVYDMLQRYDWPGNVRELQNAIKYAAAVSEGKLITATDFPIEDYYLNTSPAKRVDLNKIDLQILVAIKDLNAMGKIAGRTGICHYLAENDRSISEYRVRKGIDALLNKEFISMTEGKYGLIVTEKGMKTSK